MSEQFIVKEDEDYRRLSKKAGWPDLQRWDIRRGYERWGSAPTQEQAQYIADLLNKAPPPPLPDLDKLYPKIVIEGPPLDKILDNAVVSSAPLREILTSLTFQQRLQAGKVCLFDSGLEPYSDHLSKHLAAAIVNKIWVSDAGKIMVEVTPFGRWGRDLDERAQTGIVGHLSLLGTTVKQKFEYETTSDSITLIEYISINGLWLKPH